MDEGTKDNGSDRSGDVEPNTVNAPREVTSQCVTITLKGGGSTEFRHVTAFDVDKGFVTVAWRENGKVEARGFSNDYVLDYAVTIDESEIDAQRAQAKIAHEQEIEMQADAMVRAQFRQSLGGVQ